ncbi:MAG: FAD-binding oxidoreductase [Saprospiraceae bacterium]|nr:FAD-binding oxidoreductase [Saprospiraceae bacterium]
MSNLQYQLSYWEYDSFFRKLDAAVIGSGIVGLNAALQLKALRPDWQIAVLERGPLPIGASTRNAGFACFGSMTELLDDLAQQPEEHVWKLVQRRWTGLQRLRAKLGDQALEYREWGGYELFPERETQALEACLDQMHHFNTILKDVIGVSDCFAKANNEAKSFGFQGITGVIKNKAEGQIHTGKMMKSLLQLAQNNDILMVSGLHITAFEQQTTKVTLQTANGWTLDVPRVVLATNGFSQAWLNKPDIRPARNQVLITAPIEGLKIKGCFHYDRGYYYFRNIHNRILLGGGRNLAPEQETTTEFGFRTEIQSALQKLLHDVILPRQKVAIDHWWSGILGIGKSKDPILKHLSERVVLAARLGGMGVAIGTLVGEEAAQLLLEG